MKNELFFRFWLPRYPFRKDRLARRCLPFCFCFCFFHLPYNSIVCCKLNYGLFLLSACFMHLLCVLFQGGETRNISHFNFLTWSETEVPSSTVGIRQMIGKMQEVQRQSGNNPIVVHCRYYNQTLAYKLFKSLSRVCRVAFTWRRGFESLLSEHIQSRSSFPLLPPRKAGCKRQYKR